MSTSEILNDPELLLAREVHMARLTRLFAGEHDRNVFVLNGVNGEGRCSLYDSPEKWVEEALEGLRSRAKGLRDTDVFRPISVCATPFGVHFIDTLFGAHAFEVSEDQGCWWVEHLAQPIGELRRPDIENHPSFLLAKRVAEAFCKAEVSLPFFDAPTLSSPLNIAVNLFGQDLLSAMLEEPDRVRHDLRVITDAIKWLHRWFRERISIEQFQMILSCGRIQPPGHGQICGCTSQLLSGDLYREFIAPLDQEILELHPNGGLIHLCGSHSQHIPTWRAMRALRAVQLNDRAAEDLALYYAGLRSDQILYVNPCPGMPVDRIMDITGGLRTVIVAEIPEPIPIRKE